jgi:arylsulfatase A-like enzyme
MYQTIIGAHHHRSGSGKQFLYEEVTYIPLIPSGPGIEASALRQDLVEHIDIAALSLADTTISVPKTMQGRNLLTENYQHRNFLFAARDRCGEADDRIRSAQSDKLL